MKKRIQIITIASIAGMIVACNNSNTSPIELENNIPITIDSIATNDTDTTTINNNEAKVDKKDLDKPSYTIDIELPLYKFKNEELHNRIKDVIDTTSIKSAHAISIEYFPQKKGLEHFRFCY